MKFTEAALEAAIIDLLGKQGYPHVLGDTIPRQPDDVLITADLRAFLINRYAKDGITANEIDSIIRMLQNYPSADLYESNKAILRIVTDGFLLKREDRSQKDLFIELIDYRDLIPFRQPHGASLPIVIAERPATAYRTNPRNGANIVKIVNQLTISGRDGQTRIPDGILYINGLPLVVFEFKSAIRENTTIWDAFDQLTNRYRRDIPELFKYNAFCVISDGVNNKAGTLFSAYEFYYAWRVAPHAEPSQKDVYKDPRLQEKSPHPRLSRGERSQQSQEKSPRLQEKNPHLQEKNPHPRLEFGCSDCINRPVWTIYAVRA